LAGKKYHDNSGPSYSYTPAGRLATRTWARTPAVTTAYSYNAAGDPAGTDYSDTTPDVTVSYDRAGRPRTISDAAGTRTVAYHSSGQAEDETYADGLFGGISLDRSFDPLHRLGGIAIRGPQLSALDSYTYSYDSASRLETIAFGAHTAIYGYEADSSLIRSVSLRQQAELRLAATKIYDRLNRLASVDSVIPAGGPIRHAYDYNSANQRSRATREDGSYWNYVYDGLGQVASGTKYGAAGAAIPGHDRAWTYDDIGNRVTATRNSHVSAYTRDLLNRYTQRTVPGIVDVLGTALPGTPVVVSSGDYAAVATRQGDSFFHPIPVDNTTRARVVAVHVAAVQEPAGAALAASQGRTEFVPRTPETFTHDGDGNLVEDGRWRYAWDGENRLAAMETEEGAQAAGVRRTRLEFTYDSQGRRIGKQATRYALGGLFDVRREYFPGSTPGGTPSAIVNGGNIDDIWFQGNGLPMGLPFCYRTTATLRVPTGGAWTFQIALSYAGARLYLDDVLVLDLWNGGSNNSVTLYLTAGTEYRLRYEAKFGSDVGGATFASQLDWSGPQVARQRVPNGVGTAFAPEKVATRYVYDGWNLVAELDAAGAPVRSYAWGADVSGSRQGAGGVGGLLAVTEHTGAAATTHFAATDGNGNVAGLVRAADGSVSARYDYDAFGETVQSDGPAATVNPFRFSTKYTDDESGLLYYGYRFYHAGAGRWLGRDPLEEQGGVNLYGFLINDAVSNIDVLGLAGYFFDGTGNNRKSGTNVFIIYNAYDGIKSYYEGVGSRFGTRVVGGLTGVGGDNRLEAAYRDFIRAVDSGDRFVDIVGFSRGAALGREFANLLDERGYNPAYGGKLKHKLRASTNKPPGECEFVIRFVGLFDTVGSFGVPGNDINLGIRMDLPSAVVNAAQATAQHEMRVLFPLTPLGVRDGFSEQSFPGDHSDVGRGHGKKTNDLSRAPLEYIWNQGRSVGVPFGALPNFTPIGDTTPHDLSRRFPYNIFPKRLR
jgi:RHS repeat-associated protein